MKSRRIYNRYQGFQREQSLWSLPGKVGGLGEGKTTHRKSSVFLPPKKEYLVFQSFYDTMIAADRWQLVLQGLGTTVLIAICAILIMGS